MKICCDKKFDPLLFLSGEKSGKKLRVYWKSLVFLIAVLTHFYFCFAKFSCVLEIFSFLNCCVDPLLFCGAKSSCGLDTLWMKARTLNKSSSARVIDNCFDPLFIFVWQDRCKYLENELITVFDRYWRIIIIHTWQWCIYNATTDYRYTSSGRSNEIW